MRIKPLQQGDLDGLCGVYAVINCVRLLVPAADDSEWLDKLMVHIIGSSYTAKDVTQGGDEIKMASVFKYVRAKVEKDLGVDLTMRNSPRRGGFDSPAAIMRSVFEVGLPGAFIMGYDGRDSHWTIVRAVFGDKVLLFDSCGQTSFKTRDVVWRTTRKITKTNKILVVPGDLNWVAVGL
jgi:hypothetical protein